MRSKKSCAFRLAKAIENARSIATNAPGSMAIRARLGTIVSTNCPQALERDGLDLSKFR